MRTMALLLACIVANVPQESTKVPKGAPAVIDGRIDDAEWAGAVVIDVGNGKTVRLKHDGKTVFLGITGAIPLLSNVCIVRADTVRVLHASASLGESAYGPAMQGQRARLTDFQWALRDGMPDAASESARQAYFVAHGWAASTSAMGGQSREFGIQLTSLDRVPRLAVAFTSPFGPAEAWPRALADDCTSANFAMGQTSASAKLDPASWMALSIDQ